MKKTIFLVFLAFACSKNETSESESSNETSPSQENQYSEFSNIKNYSYSYKGEIYLLKFDNSDTLNPVLIEGKDNQILSEIYENKEQLTTVFVNDSTFQLFDNIEEYEKSTTTAIIKTDNTKKNFISEKSNSTISTTVPTYPNFNQEIYLYKDSNFRFNNKGYYITSQINNVILEEDLRSLTNRGTTYGAPFSSLFPLNFYSSGSNGSSASMNDAITSVYVNLAKLILYEHANSQGRALVLDASQGPTYYIKIKSLKDVKFSCGVFCRRHWSDRATSAFIQF